MASPPDSDAALIARAVVQDDRHAFAELVRRHQSTVRACLRKLAAGNHALADDLAQETFVLAWRNLKSFRQEARFSTWLYRIATNLAIDVLRSRGSRERTHVAHLRLVGDTVAPSAPRQVAEQEVQRIFTELAEHLSPSQRTAFVLREVEGLSTAEVSRVLGCSEATVRNHVFQARAVLRRELAARYPEYMPKGRA
jgi:RNA polymerase sigma-70 factor (ECF subfamily)